MTLKSSCFALALLYVAACSSNKNATGTGITASDESGGSSAASGLGGGAATGFMSNGGSGEAAGAGAGGPNIRDACAAEAVQAEALPVDMYIMMDQSSSMGTMYPGSNPPTTWWAVAQQAIIGFVNNTAAQGIGVAIQYFPLGGVDPQSCNVNLYQTPDVPLALLPANAAAIANSVNNHIPEAFTPTIPALTGAINYMKAWAGGADGGPSKHPGRQPVVVLVTDGYPTECPSGVQITDVAAVAADGFASKPKILTFVVGFADEGGLDNLDYIAKAGGSGKAFQITGGDLGAQFTHAMLSIASTPLSCSFDVPKADNPNNPIDIDLVSVHYVEAAPPMTESEVPKVDGLGGCSLNNNSGWYYDDPTSPQKINICPGTCALFAAGTVDIRYGCSPVVLMH